MAIIISSKKLSWGIPSSSSLEINLMNKTPLLSEILHSTLLLTEYHHSRIGIIDHHDYSDVTRKVCEELATIGEMRTNEWYEEGILALKQYYAIALLDGQNMHAVSDRVDPFWHAHILHTKQYRLFCDEVVGGYMDHDPLDHGNVAAVNHVDALYRFTRERYDEVYSHVNEKFNPRTLKRNELICVHFGSSYEAADHALFAPHPIAQPLTTAHH